MGWEEGWPRARVHLWSAESERYFLLFREQITTWKSIKVCFFWLRVCIRNKHRDREIRSSSSWIRVTCPSFLRVVCIENRCVKRKQKSTRTWACIYAVPVFLSKLCLRCLFFSLEQHVIVNVGLTTDPEGRTNAQFFNFNVALGFVGWPHTTEVDLFPSSNIWFGLCVARLIFPWCGCPGSTLPILTTPKLILCRFLFHLDFVLFVWHSMLVVMSECSFMCAIAGVRVLCVCTAERSKEAKKKSWLWKALVFWAYIYKCLYIYMRPHCSAITTFSSLFY